MNGHAQGWSVPLYAPHFFLHMKPEDKEQPFLPETNENFISRISRIHNSQRPFFGGLKIRFGFASRPLELKKSPRFVPHPARQ
jgi:hypothetical protein